MTYTREEWSRALLEKIGNHSPAIQVVQWLVAWTTLETTTGSHGAQYNLLNTTEHNTPGVVSDFNDVGVVNYDSFADGIAANAKVLANGFYNDIYSALRFNNILLLTEGSRINGELDTWGTKEKQAEIVSLMGTGMNDTFPGDLPSQDNSLAMAELTSVIPSLDVTSGICKWWLSEYTKGMYHGPALSKEVRQGDNSFQCFAGGIVDWSHVTHNVVKYTKYS